MPDLGQSFALRVRQIEVAEPTGVAAVAKLDHAQAGYRGGCRSLRGKPPASYRATDGENPDSDPIYVNDPDELRNWSKSLP